MLRTIALQLSMRLLAYAIDESLKKALPKIFARIDVEIPYYMNFKQALTPATVKGLIASATSDAIGEQATPTQTQLVRLLYDPVQAAAHLIQLRQRP